MLGGEDGLLDGVLGEDGLVGGVVDTVLGEDGLVGGLLAGGNPLPVCGCPGSSEQCSREKNVVFLSVRKMKS